MPTVIITCFDILYTIYLRLCLKKRPPLIIRNASGYKKAPAERVDVISTTITRHAGAFYLAIQITTGAEAFAALQYDFIIYRELSCLRN